MTNDWTSFLEIVRNYEYTAPEPEVPKPYDFIEVGDILLANWGYDANNPHFFKVIKRTPKQVTIVQLTVETVSYTNDGMGGKMVMPTDVPATWSVWWNNNYNADNTKNTNPVTLKKKIHWHLERGQYVELAKYAFAFKWDGQAAHDFNWH
jgi:hypothetical protein